jgi:dTDP-4-amino-4,6-dideoxygalactose transaminase
MVTTDRDDLAERLRLLRSHGMTTLTWDRHRGHASTYDVVTHGFNYRLDELHGALGRVQLRRLLDGNKRRVQHVAEYRTALQGLPGWVLPFTGYQGDTACHLMTAVAPDVEARTRAAEALRAERIQTSLHYPFIPGFTAFADASAAAGVNADLDGSLPHSRSFSARTMTLPLYPTMTIAQVEEVARVLRSSQVAAAAPSEATA